MLDAADRKGTRASAGAATIDITNRTSIDSPEFLGDHSAVTGWRQTVADYVALTKPKIISLLLVTTLGAMIIAGEGFPSVWIVLWTLIGGALASGGAGAVNHFIDRDIDTKMGRTKGRPVVTGRIAPWQALAFGIALEVASFALLAIGVNLLSAFLALAGYLFYVVIYTLWLKRVTPQNIVIGGAAGAFPPLVGWAAATGSIGTVARS
jgi:protoheme IX farnesyltransferase